MSRATVVSRKCASCGHAVGGGLTSLLLACEHCATAVDLGCAPPRVIPTLVAPASPNATGPRLTAFRFRFASVHVPQWVTGFRALGEQNVKKHFVARLEGLGDALPTLDPGPLLAPVGRDLAAARAVVSHRLGIEDGAPLPEHEVALVAFPTQRKGEQIVEPLTSWRWPLADLWPQSQWGEFEPVLTISAAVTRREQEHAARVKDAIRRRFAWARQIRGLSS